MLSILISSLITPHPGVMAVITLAPHRHLAVDMVAMVVGEVLIMSTLVSAHIVELLPLSKIQRSLLI